MSCCDDSHGPQQAAETGTTATPQLQEKFQDFMKAATAPGALDARTKRAMAIALSVVVRCDPCARIHIRRAKEEGFTQKQIDEAAMLAVSFGGCSTMMFYNELKKRP